MIRRRDFAASLLASAALVGAPALARASQTVGPFTRLPLPRFVSLRHDTTNVRRGPDESFRIDWVYRRAGLPLLVVDETQLWRRVRDHEGAGGWVHRVLLTGRRTLLVTDPVVELRLRPRPDAPVVARLERHVVGRLLTEQDDGWLRLSVDGYRGWARAGAFWGARIPPLG